MILDSTGNIGTNRNTVGGVFNTGQTQAAYFNFISPPVNLKYPYIVGYEAVVIYREIFYSSIGGTPTVALGFVTSCVIISDVQNVARNMQLNSTTCELSGVVYGSSTSLGQPVVALGRYGVTIQASNYAGSTTTTITFDVQDIAISYNSPLHVPFGKAFSAYPTFSVTNIPNTKPALTTFTASIAPALPP